MIVSLNNTKRLTCIMEQHRVLYKLQNLNLTLILTLEYSAKVIYFFLVYFKTNKFLRIFMCRKLFKLIKQYAT
jgi:hypothetical protein